MAGHRLRKKEIPWCSICLVLTAIGCHSCVLIGNIMTSKAMEKLGTSTSGWSNVGTGLSRSFQIQLDVLMKNVSDQLLDTLTQITEAQGMIDTVLSTVGDQAESAVNDSAPQALLLVQQKKAALLQQDPGADLTGDLSTDVTNVMVPVVMGVVEAKLNDAMEELNKILQQVLDTIKPALLQVGEWIVSFGQTIQDGIESFSSALDKVQKILDQVMSNLNGKGGNGEDMLHETFTLFDVSTTGAVSVQDLRDVAELFSITSLQGTKPEDLVDVYDSNDDGNLSLSEMALLVEDPSVPNIMATVLRTYAKKLTEVAGHVKDAVMRKPLAKAVVQYFQLVCAKNQTKVGWVSDALGNASLPVDFTASIYAQLCLSEGDPDLLTNADVGQMVVSRMYDLHPDHTTLCYNRMTEPEFWSTNGFNPLDQPQCVDKVSEWLSFAMANSTASSTALISTHVHSSFLSKALSQAAASLPASEKLGRSPLKLLQDTKSRHLALRAMPAVARRMAEKGTRKYLELRQQVKAKRCASLYRSRTSKHLKAKLLKGQPASAVTNPNAEQAVNGGQPAAPETLVFASYLAANASATADRFQDMSFTYSSESSSPMDAFATQIKSLVSRTSGFIEMLMTWSTPAGIQRLENYVKDFVGSAADQVLEVVKEQVETLVTNVISTVVDPLEDALGAAAGSVTEEMDKMADAIESVAAPVEDAMGQVLNATSGLLGDQTSQIMQQATNEVQTAIDNVVAQLKQGIIPGTNINAGSAISDPLGTIPGPNLLKLPEPALLEQPVEGVAGMADMLGGSDDAIQNIVNTFTTLTNLLPTATSTLVVAQEQVSSAASVMDSVFELLGIKGPEIFDLISLLWKVLWIAYFCIMAPLTLAILYYAFWAGGFFGGPQPLTQDNNNAYEPPKTCWQRLRVCCSCCCLCCQKCHDTQLCFWSSIIFMQIIILIIFVISIVLCILAGVKAFVTAGCSEVYMLSDPTVCSATMGGIKNWLSSFIVAEAAEALDQICPTNNLLTCDMIAGKMKTSMLLTTVFSFVAVIMSLQILIESATLHEHARFRRLYAERQLEREELEKESRRDGALESSSAMA